MQKRMKAIYLLMLFTFIIFIFLIGAVSAASCDVRLRTNCQTDPMNNIVMGISASTNAHGEKATDGTYPYVLCCDFGTGDTGCELDNSNKILGLSALTNAHAEIPSGTIYPDVYDVCYKDVECVSITSGSCADTIPLHDIQTVSLSSSTNAHLGAFADYSTKICCKTTSQFISPNCDLTSASWEFSEVMEGAQVDMILQGTNCAGAAIEFNIYEDDGILGSDPIAENPISGNFPGQTWVAKRENEAIGDPEYYFTAKATVSGDTFSSLDITTGNKILTVKKSDLDCNTINLCEDYTSWGEPVCTSDSSLCNVAPNSPPTGVNCDDPLTKCDCVWDSETCKFASTSNPAPVICENGFTLCNTEPLLETGMDYCYPGSECPTDETPLSDGDSVCDVGEGCSSIDCKDGDTDSCVQGATCLSGKCNIAGQTPVDITGCEQGYTLCNTEPLLETGMNYCYPGDTCPAGENILGNDNEICESGESCNSPDCIPGGDPVLHKDTCLLDAYCKDGSCFSPTYAVGTCIYSTSTDDVCPGILSYNWTATWEGTGDEPSCKDGGRTYACPAQAKLPFFNIYSLIGAIVLIILIYLVLTLKKKKMKLRKRVGSKRRKRKR